ncbi:tetratricopeptide repeat domain protein [Aspergillus minisclerotigenes]|uniref:Tetratricopeptide repeat domain protein n=1 Tax=Aspergillus minisclerotigenes TaxID=656917 RepID=A0A5N6JP94_9EURO|nr:tetratricopeptide repeat domain protein [Aspergillus minisclerotigenes]
MTNTTTLKDCTIVWICSQEVALRAAIVMLDNVRGDVPSGARGNNVPYTVGDIGSHTVAVAGYHQEHGLAASGAMVAEVLRDLPNLEMGLLVGNAGGIPSPTRDIRLGDVVVAVPERDCSGVIGYDLGKADENDTFQLKHWQNSTHPLLRSVINVIRARNEFGFLRHLHVLEELPGFQKPDSSAISDEWSMNHQSRTTNYPFVHYGTVLSGNRIIRSKERRDYLRDKYGGIAVEMEAAGMMTRLPVAVIRGISNFADSSRKDCWKSNAAITAAAYAKEVLRKLPPEVPRDSPSLRSAPFVNQDTRLAQTLPERCHFVGREDELKFIDQELGFQAQQPLKKSIVAFWGLSGVGKSQLASKFVHQQRSKHPKREIFWVNGESQEAFEHSLGIILSKNIKLSKSVQPTVPQEQDTSLVSSFLAELNRLEDQRWFLVVDGLNGRSIPSPHDSMSFCVHDIIRRLRRGYVLLVARRRDVVEEYHPNRELKGLIDEDAIHLLHSRLGNQLTEAGGIELVSFFKGHPLSLQLATSVISRYRYTTAKYLEKWKNHGKNEQCPGINKPLFLPIEQSFRELESTDPIAVKVLTLFSYLDYRDLWYGLCLSAQEETYPTWLRNLAKEQKSFRSFCPILADLSFIELRYIVDGHQLWEIHPAVQAVARQRTNTNEQEYIRCAISLVAAQLPRSNEDGLWKEIRQLEPHATRCWSYIQQGRWGPYTNLTELEALGGLFHHAGQSDQASLTYRMIEKALNQKTLTIPEAELLADVFTNLGLVYINQINITSHCTHSKVCSIDDDWKARGAEKNLRNAAAYFARHKPDQYGLTKDERKQLYIRILNDLGDVLLRKDAVAAASDIFSHILDSQRGVLGESHPTIVSTKLNLGKANAQLGEFSIANSFLGDVIAIYTEWWGRRHPVTMRAVDELALASMEESEHKNALGVCAASEPQNAERLWKEVFDFYENTYGSQSDMAGRIKINLQCLYSSKLGHRQAR